MSNAYAPELLGQVIVPRLIRRSTGNVPDKWPQCPDPCRVTLHPDYPDLYPFGSSFVRLSFRPSVLLSFCPTVRPSVLSSFRLPFCPSVLQSFSPSVLPLACPPSDCPSGHCPLFDQPRFLKTKNPSLCPSIRTLSSFHSSSAFLLSVRISHPSATFFPSFPMPLHSLPSSFLGRPIALP